MRTFLQQRLAEKEMGSRLDSELRKSSRAGSFRVRIRMRVRRDRVSGLELAQHYHSAGAFVLVQKSSAQPLHRDRAAKLCLWSTRRRET
jgi:hypothetical protein